jgi:hypothetical protein
LLNKKTTQHLGDILTIIVSSKHTIRRGKLSVNHGSKPLIDRKNLTARMHKVESSVLREVVNKYQIVAMAPF